MGYKKVDAYVGCPYYKRDGKDKREIICEGVQDGATSHQAFGNILDLEEYKWQFCKGDYNKCLIAQMLNRKYDYEAK